MTREHVRQFFVHRMIGHGIKSSTLNVQVAAVEFAGKQATHQPLIASETSLLTGIIKSLRRLYDDDVEGCHVLLKQSYIVFRLGARKRADASGRAVGVPFPVFKQFMLRRSEIATLQRTHVHMHKEPVDFIPTDMVIVELVENKSYAYRTQSVSYVLSESVGPCGPAAYVTRLRSSIDEVAILRGLAP